MKYKTIVGLEIHVELSTNTKAFCSCKNSFGDEPNTNVCPVCLALPGGMPVLNRNVINYTVMAGTAFNCKINNKSKFDRKNYFYPDLTKGFQITQNDSPICTDGYLEIESEDGKKKIGLFQIQMEEDTAKSLHTEENETLMDYNRCGVPLIEIVTKPDISSGKEAREFLEKLKSTLRFLGISDCKMEEGSLRCDVNVNVKDLETGEKTQITEVKNLNSFRGVEKAIDFEVERHIKLLENHEEEIKTTRRWDDAKNETVLMRVKYTANDYRFAPEGDLPIIHITDDEIKNIVESMPELPEAMVERFVRDYKITREDALVLTSSRELAKFFEDVASDFSDYTLLSNWIQTEILRRIEISDDEIFELPFENKEFIKLLNAIKSEKISNNAGKKVLREMFETGDGANEIIERLGLVQMTDLSAIEKIVDEVLSENEQSIIDFKEGKDRALGFLVGQVMKKSRGKANPKVANEMLVNKMNKR
ncbi:MULTISPECIES: Asp-tRNA(Asn)/Glu-tRNA(Gln) amidotransferase subunit GatB [Peptoniphilus]|jgi:aspartyl/glutamyl-tRNA(asn/gln) amidotransferase, B subunit|uniref:Asp-tRNA(Asn)/Glu-tRNA(Gln) amidotransferase subunit GatB n=1 Tax=Peptoniphilus TaxID=162289 RepID=UPI000288A3B4|nr:MULTISPECIES: Asp-tRNA(Asn)/Glu-tRNA(Gln) amidotransferase subunit GatB [Peptoniphilus]MDU1043815.1 Asp-tRNA(Asn)/Glu-tRNA(Gln) amidotransferase subunit GatB [Peptoniphilus rhinitidis]MDU1954692.1 Asp-tRNA(Asn)/Glu-tRNA(Gln) amidotransferase subunit GatB [Peptoniphilus lacydonensis]MDU2110374.1 Asp-tRNA(Asn)/Glu-tRNA(Gln) amidotransferase subunit GatB [Peptoniphilus lacydonensis]MDU2115840.1 Asp-tRNA(Asn)/Glu-tRNA(Gln) amidotransferase subunit GatB [Peptoniphilus lacydonensis]MDU3750941.1 A